MSKTAPATLDEHERARLAAMRLLAARALTSAELRAKLERQGHEPGLARDVVERLAELRLVNDDAAVENELEHGASSAGVSRASLAARLQARGIPSGEAESMARETMTAEDEAANAESFARKKVAASPAGLDRKTLRRRVLAALGRRGFGAEIAEAAAIRVLGETTDDNTEAQA